jgi:hypothetical protein
LIAANSPCIAAFQAFREGGAIFSARYIMPRDTEHIRVMTAISPRSTMAKAPWLLAKRPVQLQ